MAPPAKKDWDIILFDVNASNKEEGVAALMKICTFNWLSETKDSYRVILSNTKESKNVQKYSNLYDTGPSDLDPQPILNKIKTAEREEGDWLNALLLAISHLKKEYEMPGTMTLRILYITKLDGCLQEANMTKVEQIINDLREYKIYLYIIGPEVKLPFTITSESDVSDAMKEISVDESKPPLAAAKRIIDATDNTVMCDLKVGINLFFSFRNPQGTRPWKVPMTFGSSLEIPVCTVKTLNMVPSIKLTQNNRGSLKYILLEDESVQVGRSELVSGIERHGKFVQIDGEDREMFKVEGPRCFAVVGFAERKDIPEYYMREGSYCVLPDPDKPMDCSQALYHLVDILAEEKKYVVMRRIYNNNNRPKYFVLVPQPDSEPKHFIMAELPFADDLKQHFRVTEPVISEKIEDDEFKQFFNSIDIWHDDCKLNVPLGPKMMVDPNVMKLTNAAANKYLKQELSFDRVDINDFEVGETNEFLEAVKASWPQDDQTKADDEMEYS